MKISGIIYFPNLHKIDLTFSKIKRSCATSNEDMQIIYNFLQRPPQTATPQRHFINILICSFTHCLLPIIFYSISHIPARDKMNYVYYLTLTSSCGQFITIKRGIANGNNKCFNEEKEKKNRSNKNR